MRVRQLVEAGRGHRRLALIPAGVEAWRDAGGLVEAGVPPAAQAAPR